MSTATHPPGAVRIDYTNWRGERSMRIVQPYGIRWAESKWHIGPQWILDAFDIEKGADRTFAMKDIHRWEQLSISEVP